MKTFRLKHKLIAYSSIFYLLLTGGCKKFVEVSSPIMNITETNVYADDVSAISVLTGMYTNLSTGRNFATGSSAISLMSGLSADEFTLHGGAASLAFTAYYDNQLSATSTRSYGSESWNPLYNYIFTSNSAIEGLTAATTLTPVVQQQLLGEAKFMRAFFYFQLVNLFGDVPLAITTDYVVNATLHRAAREKVYEQIINDLKDAQGLLRADYVDGGLQPYPPGAAERVRPTSGAAAALLARVYLYHSDWANAEAEASKVINNSSLYALNALNEAFLKNSTEAIWQLQPVNAGWNTEDAKVFIIPSTGPSAGNPVYLNPHLLNRFEVTDQRKINWIGSVTVGTDTFYFPYKYKIVSYGDPVTEYLMVLRLGEQYLIRAEARAQQDNIAGAREDLDAIRTRAGLSNTTANDKVSLLTAILHERRIELFSEWGHRWLDLKRTGKVDEVMQSVAPLKGGTWETTDQLYPLPIDDIQRDLNLVQNPGY